MRECRGIPATWSGDCSSEVVRSQSNAATISTTPSAEMRVAYQESALSAPLKLDAIRQNDNVSSSSPGGGTTRAAAARGLANNIHPWSSSTRVCPTATDAGAPLYYCYARTVTTDPAARYVPLRGKLGFTQGLTIACLILMVCSCIVGRGITSLKENPMLGPDVNSLLLMGALKSSLVRSGEWWRLFWAVYLHAGWFHLVMNFILWYRLGVMIEPDWGFCRTLFVFQFSAVTGNLLSATLDPYNVSVGASGGIFGVMGGCIPYIIEYWHTIPKPKCILYIVIGSLLLGIACGFMPYIDNYAHMGGAMSGVLLGFATITNIEMGRTPTRKRQLTSGGSSSKHSFLRRWLGFRGKSAPMKAASACNNTTTTNSSRVRSGGSTDPPALLQKSLELPLEQGAANHGTGRFGSSNVKNGSPLMKAPDSSRSPYHAMEDYNPRLEADQSQTAAVLDDSITYEARVDTSSSCNSTANADWSRNGTGTPSESVNGNNENNSASGLHVSLESNSKRATHDRGSPHLELLPKHRVSRSPGSRRAQQQRTPRHFSQTSMGSPSTWRMEALEFARANQVGMVYRPRSEGVPRRKVPSRVTIRSTLKENVTDSFVWDDKVVWTVRIAAAVFLITAWTTMYYYLFVCSDCYTAPGQLVTVRSTVPDAGRGLLHESSDPEAEAVQASLEWLDSVAALQASQLVESANNRSRGTVVAQPLGSVVPEIEESGNAVTVAAGKSELVRGQLSGEGLGNDIDDTGKYDDFLDVGDDQRSRSLRRQISVSYDQNEDNYSRSEVYTDSTQASASEEVYQDHATIEGGGVGYPIPAAGVPLNSKWFHLDALASQYAQALNTPNLRTVEAPA